MGRGLVWFGLSLVLVLVFFVEVGMCVVFVKEKMYKGFLSVFVLFCCWVFSFFCVRVRARARLGDGVVAERACEV